MKNRERMYLPFNADREANERHSFAQNQQEEKVTQRLIVAHFFFELADETATALPECTRPNSQPGILICPL